jgi:isopropylmalate/homocitrate/citramalate synthase|tara:strand:- start:34 stop:273 length:240 start_codon:yes stop_codon:yes gene_type:complete
MQAAWVKGLKGPQKEKRKAEVLGYRNAFDSLKEILERDFKKKEAVRDYEVPNWELRQVAANEYNQVLDDMLKLITINKD